MGTERGTLRIAAETELQNAHARKAELVSNRFHFGSDHAQILCHQGQFAKNFPGYAEEFAAGAFHPAPVLRRAGRHGNFPISSNPRK